MPGVVLPEQLSNLSPQKLQGYDINKLSDLQVWDLPNEVICDAALKSWRSDTYQHFNLSLFSCKQDPKNHLPQFRARKDTGSGTHNLRLKALACDARVQQTKQLTTAPRTFSPSRFRAILALWCARNHHPYELVEDPLYAMLVDELRPGTQLPDRTTISRDVRTIYELNVDHIRDYFNDIDRIHLAIDGWTAPNSISFLGIVIIWHQFGRVRRTVLEFIKLSEKHTGEYLARQTAACLNRYRLGSKLLTVCMDNASNNNTFTTELQKHFPTFGGPSSRLRCTAHIIHLMAKAFLSVFSEPTKRISKQRADPLDQSPEEAPKRQRIDEEARFVPRVYQTRSTKVSESVSKSNTTSDPLESLEADQETESDDGNNSETEDIEIALMNDCVDDAKVEHDNKVVNEKVERAFSEVDRRFSIKVSNGDREQARKLIPKVSKLAKRVHESPYIRQKFEECINSIPHLANSQRRSLVRRVATRWNTDLECIRSHVYLRDAVQALTKDRSLSLRQYQLTENQWTLAEQLTSVLRVFEQPTKLFSEAEVPLVHEVIPILFKLRDRLEKVRSDPTAKLNPIVRVAAHAALEVFTKYMHLFADSDIYWVALVMCPYAKLQWFSDHSYSQDDIKHVQTLVRRQFDRMFGNQTSPPSPSHYGDSQSLGSSWADSHNNDDGWVSDDETESYTSSYADTLDAYFAAPIVPTAQILAAGGLLGYWTTQRTASPRVAQFALNILSAPASSVDAERAFSGGRLTINHLQHSMGEVTFGAKMAIGSWYNTPLLPSVDHAAAILSSRNRLSL